MSPRMRCSFVLLAALCAEPTLAAAGGPPVPPAGWTQGWALTADGARLNYWRTGGDKPPLVLLHGFSDDGLCWTEVASKLEADFDVIMTDARGHGLSDPPAADDQMAAQVRDIGTVIEALDLENPIVMGHSMGSASAAMFAAGSPDVPRAVVLVDPRLTPWPQRRGGNDDADDADRERRAMRQILDRNNTPYEELLAQCQRQSPGWSRTECEYWARSKRLYHPHLAKRSKGERESMGELFPKITAPTLILKADAPAEEQAENQAIADRLAAGKLVHIPDAGHSVHRDELERFLAELDAFLDGLD